MTIYLLVRLADAGLLSPQEEATLVSRHPEAAGSYRVLRREARGQAERSGAWGSSSLLLLLAPLPHHHQLKQVILTLERSTVAAPALELWPRNASSAASEAMTLRDCFYSGGGGGGGSSSHNTWAVMSTCDGLSGIILHNGKGYRLEELQPLPQQQQLSLDLHEAQDSPLLVIFPLSLPSTFATGARNLTHLLGDSHTEVITNTRSKEAEDVVGHRITTREARKTPYTVELAVFIDDSLVSYVRKRYPSTNAKRKTKEIVMTLLTVVNQLFSDPSLGNAALSLRVLRLKFLGRRAVDEAEGEGSHYLSNFCMWQAPRSTKRGARLWDHSLLLTGLDLYSEHPYTKRTMGMSFVGGMCTADHSCSVVEATKFTCAYTIAHEMGHSLNLVHDGDPPASACKATGHLMAVSLNDGGHTWSSCSRNQLKAFLDMRGTCLTEESGGGGGNNDANNAFLHGDLPGRTFDADQQCHYMFGEGWRHAAEQYPDVCAEIWCVKGLRLRSPLVSALDGTTCENDKVCLKGLCTSLRAAVRTGTRKDDYEMKKLPKWRKKKMIKKMKQMVKKLMKVRSRKQDEKETAKNGSNIKLTKQKPEVRKDIIGTTRKEKGEENKEAKNAEKKQATKEYMEILKDLLEEIEKSTKVNEGKTSWEKSNAREKRIDPLWWMGGTAKQEDRVKVKTQNTPVKRNGDRREDSFRLAKEKNSERDKRKRRKRRKGNRQHNMKRRLPVLDGPGKRKRLPKIRKIESPTHIIIKERMNYVEGRGWKVNILKIKKSKKLSNKRIKVKKYTLICDKNLSKCRISKKQTRNTVRMLGRKAKSRKVNKMHSRRIKNKSFSRNASKKTKQIGAPQVDSYTPSIIRTKETLSKDPCLPRKVKYTSGKGWLIKVSSDCLKPSNTTAEPVIE